MRFLTPPLVIVFSLVPMFSVSANTGATSSPSPSNTADAVVASALSESLGSAPSSPSSTVSYSAGSDLGEYKSVNCNSNTAFAAGSCNQCFDGGSLKVGTRITGLFDTWTNPSSNVLKAVMDEQKSPNMMKLGNTVWLSTPANEASIWKYASDVVWTTIGTGSSAKKEFLLQPRTKVRFIEADIGAGYTLERTDRKNGEPVGLLRFPVVSRTIDVRTANESAPNTHYECVLYKLDAPAPAVTPPAPSPQPKPTPPKEMTKTETGPETLLLILAAFFIAFGMMLALRKRT